jgi:hypothetical protein
MGYYVEISLNMLKETHFSEFENTIVDIANSYDCESIYLISEEDGTIKIPRYHCVFVIHFIDENFDNFIKFLRIIKHSKKGNIESIYDNDKHKLLYASSYYLSKINMLPYLHLLVKLGDIVPKNHNTLDQQDQSTCHEALLLSFQ